MKTLTNESPAVHEWTGPTGVNFRDVREPSGIYYRDTTPRAVIDGLERAYRTGERIRLWTGDPLTGKNWYDEYDVTGTVGRSMGPIRIPLLIASPRSSGGGAIGTDAIVCLRVGGREVWRAPGFEMPAPVIKAEEFECYHCAAYLDGKLHARFKTQKSAQRWADFMSGRRDAK